MIITEIIHTLKHALVITGFVFVMMLAIEYINVQTKGLWQKAVSGNKLKQYIFSGLLGAVPGCLGAFTSVSMFTHGMLSIGAIVTTMIATSGDEAFVMLAMFPEKAIILTVIIFGIGIFAGWLTDKFLKPEKSKLKLKEPGFAIHQNDKCVCFNKKNIFLQLIKPSVYRIVLFVLLVALITGILTGVLAGNSKEWIRITVLVAVGFSLFIVLSVPDHFLEEHLWKHVVKVHLPRIFLWTFGTLLVFAVLMKYINIENWISSNMFFVLLIAVLVGIIPESGPHLIFVTLFAQGTIPFSILLASSIAQDGHGMLPLLAESKRSFVVVKIINIIFGFSVGLLGLLVRF
ncbi:MAG: putative manganese transporter [Bacteroidales bacterium]|nr:putative manganese transporter [Bacteroidales bacterium]